MTTTPRKPAAPAGLNGAGRALWRRVVTEYELRADELRLLEDACRTADVVDQLTADLKGQPSTVKGVGGQLRAHPLLTEVRAQRVALAAMLKQLKLPDEPGEARATTAAAARSVQARAAAQTRWRRGTRGTA